ncbi:hypothetical protein GBAR_LOCUS2272 [Geodia barretti]|uniref:Uncharacterized protein n=1 Tax=Geodia barretti TaxID=519541 RepID=A0AA35VYC1_GEOBA|nr:hypothetical protein GBAR_LOCUS2272 [Geodia barretti]
MVLQHKTCEVMDGSGVLQVCFPVPCGSCCVLS